METFYVTFCNDLSGYCVAVSAANENDVREHAAKNYGKLWCSVYTKRPSEKILAIVCL